MRGNCSTEDEPGYRQLLHGSSSPRRVYACSRVIRQPGLGERLTVTTPPSTNAEAIWSKL
jgi:hypothetical protein